ncbi:MAG: hypothetical protein ACR2GX_08975 [Candidatus Dormibacteria bacterium]
MKLATRVGSSRQSTTPYQFSLRTSRSPAQVLSELEERRLPGIGIAEHGTHYLVLRPQRRHRYSGDIAVGLAAAIVLAVLISTAVTPWLSILLPLAILPALPLLGDDRPDLAASAVEDDDHATRVTVHGQASAELAAALDAYLGALPPPPDPGNGVPS